MSVSDEPISLWKFVCKRRDCGVVTHTRNAPPPHRHKDGSGPMGRSRVCPVCSSRDAGAWFLTPYLPLPPGTMIGEWHGPDSHEDIKKALEAA